MYFFPKFVSLWDLTDWLIKDSIYSVIAEFAKPTQLIDRLRSFTSQDAMKIKHLKSNIIPQKN